MRQYLVAVLLWMFVCTGSMRAYTRYEYWFDMDTAHMCGGVCDEYGADIAVSVELLSPGIHFFNFHAVDESGQPGELSRTMFYIPDDKSVFQYGGIRVWFDDDCMHETICSESKVSVSLPEDMTGLHVLNILPYDADGSVGRLTHTLFYASPRHGVDVSGYEYWFDEEDDNAVFLHDMSTSISVEIDASALVPGSHTFNIRAFDCHGNPGEVYSEGFLVSDLTGLSYHMSDAAECYTVYTLSGICLMRDVPSEKLSTLSPGMYVINGSKILLR